MSNIPGFYSLKVKNLNKETANAVTITFDIPDELKKEFEYKAGQYLTLEMEINGERVRRAYSLCTAPEVDTDLAVTVKTVKEGKMSTFVNNNLNVGDIIDVMPPNGKFIVEPDSNANKHYILFGGGSGITPLMGIIKTVLAKEPNSNIHLVYANQNTDSVIFKAALEELEKNNKNRFKIFYSYDKAPMMWFGLKGLLNEKSVGEIVKQRIGGAYTQALYYICGPSPLMDVVKKGLAQMGIPSQQVFTEYFTSATDTKKVEEKPVAAQGKSKVLVKLYGKESTIEVDDNQTILDAANAAGLQPPYSCTVGVCTTCRAKVLKGKVEMIEREGLSDSEIEEGYVLTCQSLPRSQDIELIYE